MLGNLPFILDDYITDYRGEMITHDDTYTVFLNRWYRTLLSSHLLPTLNELNAIFTA